MKQTLFLRVGVATLLRATIAGIFLILILGLSTSINHAQTSAIDSDGAIAPYQQALQSAVNSRRAAGLPVPPSVTYNNNVIFSAEQHDSVPAESIPGVMTLTAITTVQFDNPQQAGYERWPDFDFEGTNLNDQYYARMQAEVPGIWDTYQFGYEPRTYTTTETIVRPFAATALTTNSTVSSGGDILMGFTFDGPNINYTISDTVEVLGVEVASYRAGFALDWGAGLRLPGRVSLTGPSQMINGNVYQLESAFTPTDWSEVQFVNTGVAGEEGNEFVLFLDFFVGLSVQFFGQELCTGYICDNITVNPDFSTSFTTPFGVGAAFPMPPLISSDIYERNFGPLALRLGLEVTPLFGSDKITADWRASGDAIGSGTLRYNEAGELILVGDVIACDISGDTQAHITISNFDYFFNRFGLELSLYGAFDVFGYEAVRVTIPVGEVDFSEFTDGIGLSVGDHVQCNVFLQCGRVGPSNSITLSIPVLTDSAPQTFIYPAGTPGDNGWWRSDVTVTLAAQDGTPACPGEGVAYTEYSLDGVNWTQYTSPLFFSTEGITLLYYRSMDVIGNLEATRTAQIKIDKTPPSITAVRTPPPNENGWNNTNVLVDFTATDSMPGSGIAFMTQDVTLTAEGAGQSVSGTTRDYAGWTDDITVSDINIDKTPPELTVLSPLPGEYPNTEMLMYSWIASDALSGIGSEVALVNGQEVANGESETLLLFPAGDHTVFVEAVDRADNVTAESVSFSVTVNLEGLGLSLDYMCEIGWITQQGICRSMRAKIDAAIAAMRRCQPRVAINQLTALLHQLDAQYGHHLTFDPYNVMTINTIYVINHLNLEFCESITPITNASYEEGDVLALDSFVDTSALTNIAASIDDGNNSNSNDTNDANNNDNDGDTPVAGDGK
jgi:hypothetical protein